MKVLISRAEPAASQTAITLAKFGHEAVLLPLFEIIDTGNPLPDTQIYDGMILTSKNAVEILANRGWKLDDPNLPAFCVGERTKQAAIKLGFKNTFRANGGGAALVNLMAGLGLESSQMLYLSTPDKSFDMKMALKPNKIDVETVDIYQAKPFMPDSEEIKEAILSIKGGYIFVYSALSGKQLAEILLSNNIANLLKQCTLISISNQAAKPLENFEWKRVLVAKKPDETSMIELID